MVFYKNDALKTGAASLPRGRADYTGTASGIKGLYTPETAALP
jgi:hypothetical protein